MVIYAVKAIVKHKSFDMVVEKLNKMGHDDIVGMHAEVKIGTITTEQPLTKEEKEVIVDAFMKRKSELEEIIGLPISDFKLEEG